MFIITRALSTPQEVDRRESSSMFCETKYFLTFEQIAKKAWESGHNKTQTAHHVDRALFAGEFRLFQPSIHWQIHT